ncbi:glycine zipper 2TM domain-containing protein [Asticcacaulis sp. 201]|uniref:glycine zipper 2TM domain-containing protein n=1 Tax=Asticcacaulis sp. 201 TaxID=3028787 RepID=UPI0029168184|nr:glycine zipper 2TM domain-containing protein [Asticcacaulis sp. 201]MDV6332689.1 glycine zipper 2TM domain-containing protein [Asticcacaulis sp. 201]
MINLRKLTVPSLLALATVSLGLPMAAHAQYDTRAYDGYCYTRKSDAGTNGAVLGAVIGGLAGSQVSKHERGLGTVGGAVIGGVIGNQVGKSSVKCYNGAYYAYRPGRYYSPPPAPEGYDIIYFRDRPQTGYYDNVYYDPPSQQAYNNGRAYSDDSDYQSQPYNGPANSAPQPYRSYSDNSSSQYSSSTYQGSSYGAPRPRSAQEGWRDDQGQWHDGRPRNIGWQDDDGRWHVGQVVAYGWRDRNGGWHEETNSYQSSNYSSGN